MSENIKVALSILGLLLLVAVILGSIWARIWAPCDWIDWLPVKDVPTRCLEVGVR